MFKEALNKEQLDLLPELKKFKNKFFLAGGTAIALQIGHRKSIDFDLFTNKNISLHTLESTLKKDIEKILVRTTEELTIIIKNVKITFLKYPFKIEPKIWLNSTIKMPALLDLAAMKAYTLGRRNELKDYVDLYFLLKNNFKIEEIENRAKKIFGTLFSQKLFRVHLVYFDSLNWEQDIEFIGKKLDYSVMRKSLENIIKKGFN